MGTKDTLSFRNRYSKYLLIWAFVGSLFCLIGPVGDGTQIQQKAQIESVIGFRQWLSSSPSYHKTQQRPLKVSIAERTLYVVALWCYNSKADVLFNRNQYHLSLFEPFRFFVIPKIIPPAIGS